MSARLLAAVAALLTAGAGGAADAPKCQGALVWFASMATGPDAGIVAGRLDERRGALCAIDRVATVERPNWIAVDRQHRVLFTTSESKDPAAPSIHAFRLDPVSGGLTATGAVRSGGLGATHLSYDPRTMRLFAAHWGDGAVSAMPVDAAGRIAPPASVMHATGTGPARFQNNPRAHAVALAPGGHYLLATDFAGDGVLVFRLTRDGGLSPGSQVRLPPGSGPRHLAVDPNGRFVFVVNQLNSTVTSLTWDGRTGSLSPIATISTVAPGFTQRNDAAGIAISGDGRFVYVSNRGEDSIVGYAIDRAGRLLETTRIGSGGRTPRAITLAPSGRWLLVANQGSNGVAVAARDPRTGRLTETSQRLALPMAAGATFLTR